MNIYYYSIPDSEDDPVLPVAKRRKKTKDELILEELQEMKRGRLERQKENKVFQDKVILLCESADQNIKELLEIIKNKK